MDAYEGAAASSGASREPRMLSLPSLRLPPAAREDTDTLDADAPSMSPVHNHRSNLSFELFDMYEW